MKGRVILQSKVTITGKENNFTFFFLLRGAAAGAVWRRTQTLALDVKEPRALPETQTVAFYFAAIKILLLHFHMVYFVIRNWKWVTSADTMADMILVLTSIYYEPRSFILKGL